MSTSSTNPAAPDASHAGANAEHHESHPRGLYTLFGAEAWERFSYYGMRALLVLYMVNHLKFTESQALGVYAVYTGLVYLTPIAGGMVADKLLGRRKAVLIGGLVMALGHVAMAFEPLLYPALGLLIVGNGFFKPNISTIVGGLYEEGDPRRDGGFTIFYMGINLGAFFAPLVCGSLGESKSFGWHYGFSAAAVGMVLGLAQFVFGQKHLKSVGLPPKSTTNALLKKDYVEVLIWVVALTALVFGITSSFGFLAPVFAAIPAVAKIVVGLVVAGLVLVQLYRSANREEIERISVILVLCIFNIFFWMGFEQAGGSMTLFADKQTDRVFTGVGMLVVAIVLALGAYNIRRDTKDEVGGRLLWLALTLLFGIGALALVGWSAKLFISHQTFEAPASLFQSINALVIVVLAPTFSRLWERLDSGRFKTSTPTKMAIGLVVLGLGFVVMYIGKKFSESGPVSPAWLAVVYVIHTMGELCLSPIGLSMVTKLAPSRVVSLAMGVWFLSIAVANYLAGTLGSLLESSKIPLFGFLVVAPIGAAIVLLALTPILKKWMHGRA